MDEDIEGLSANLYPARGLKHKTVESFPQLIDLSANLYPARGLKLWISTRHKNQIGLSANLYPARGLKQHCISSQQHCST